MRTSIGWIATVLFVLCVPISNWLVGNVGVKCIEHGPCLVPVFPGISAPSGVLAVGVAFVVRDIVQRQLGAAAAFIAVIIGGVISLTIAPAALALASAAAYIASELIDQVTYSALRRFRFVLAVFVSSLVGLIVDSFLFVLLAFGSFDFVLGQIVGKLLMVGLSLPVAIWIDREVGERAD